MGVTLIPTVRVTFLNGGHSGHISAKDFDPQLHVLWVDPVVKSVEEKVVLSVLAAKAVDAVVVPETEEQVAEDTLAEERAARRAASIAKAQAAAAVKRAEKRAEKEVDPQ